MSSRIDNSIKNTIVSFVAQILSIILSFVTRTIFIKILGIEYLGINGLFLNILSMLSFAELGIGTAIIFSMYKPLAENNRKRISALMNLYEKAYKIIGITIFILGLSIIPFLKYLIKGNNNINYLTIIYLLFLINSVISYFYAYKRSILIANQYAYINTINQMIFLIIQNLVQIIVLVFYKQYILYLIVQILVTMLSNVFISRKVDKLFPYLKFYKKEIIDVDTRKHIKKNVLGTMSSRLGGIIVTGTDNLLISAFIGVGLVGIYSNYILILNTVTSIITQIFNSITASIGNLIATENNEKSYDIFKKLFFINFLITEFCTVFFITLLNPFISIWIGEEYLLSNLTVFLIVINFFIIQMRKPAIIFIDTYGLYWEIKWKSFVEAIINLVSSILLVKFIKLGVSGVILGTCISNILTNLWWEPYVVYKHGFNRKFSQYFYIYIKYLISGIFTTVITIFLANRLIFSGILELIVKSIICIIIPSVIIGILFFSTNEFKYTMKILKKVCVRKVRR